MGRVSDKTARRKAQAAEYNKRLKERVDNLLTLDYDVYKSGSYNGEESWCYRKCGELENGSAWDSQEAVVDHLETKLNLK